MPRSAAFMLLLGSLGCSTFPGDGTERVAAAQSPTHEATVAIEGMTCASCAVTVKLALRSLPGIADVRVDTAHGRAIVRFDPTQVNAATIAAAITEAGYVSTVLGEREG